jgi:class 3 adenylate cyclase
MGAQLSKPFKDLTTEEISQAVANLGERYKPYCDILIGNGVDGSLLESLNDDEVEETLDDLEITNRLHRRVLLKELNKAKSNKDFVSSSYEYGPSTPSSDLEPYCQITDKIFCENKTTAVLAGVHLVLNNGNQLALDTKILKDGQVITNKLTVPRKLSVCSGLVNDGRNQDYYKVLLPQEIQMGLIQDTTPMTYTGHVLKSLSGKRVGMVCMVDRCSPADVVDIDRETFLRQMAQETEYQLTLRKQLLERKKKLEGQISECQNETVLPAHGPLKPVFGSQVSQRLRKQSPIDFTELIPQPAEKATHKLPIFQNMASEEEKVHLPTNFYDSVDEVSAPRPPIPKHDMERSAAVEALGMTDINPQDEIALHLKSLVKMAAQVFGFPHGEITFHNHESQYRIAGYGESDEIINSLNSLFQSIQCNRDGSRFLCKMPRGPAVCNYVIASGRTFVVQDLAADETFQWLAEKTPLRSYVGTPVKDSAGRLVAVLCLFDTKPRPDFETAHEIQIEQVASLISQSLENWALTRSIERLAQERQVITQGRNKSSPPTGKVTLVLTDIQGSTALWEADSGAMQESQDIHDDIIRQLGAAHWGYEIETEGDAFALAFHDPVDAFGFALKAQKALFEAKWPAAMLSKPEAMEEASAFRGLRVRMAIHHGIIFSPTGEASERSNYKGETMTLTKTLVSMAQGGQILTTSETWEVASYFMGSILGYPQVVDHGCHVIQKGKTTRDGLIMKRIIQLVPSNLAYDYFAARKHSSAPEVERHDVGANGQLTGRHFPPIASLRLVSASFHDAPFKDNKVSIAFINMSDVDDRHGLVVVNLVGTLLDGMPELRGYQCQNEMLAFHNPVDAILFGLHLQAELCNREPLPDGTTLGSLVKYACIHDSFLTMGPHRTTGRADYFGKIVNRAARLSSAAAPGSVCFGLIVGEHEKDHANFLNPVNHPLINTRFIGKKALRGIQEEISAFECSFTSHSLSVVNDAVVS